MENKVFMIFITIIENKSIRDISVVMKNLQNFINSCNSLTTDFEQRK